MSTLYPLKPEGVGSWCCEGLVSYLCRLANAHTVAVDDLVNLVLNDLSDADFRTWRHFSFWNRSNAVSLYTKARTIPLRDALYRATEVNEVQNLSLASLADVIDLTGTAATEARHCAMCYRDTPYPSAIRPLLWDFAAVTICPRHSCALVPSRCEAPPSQQRALWSRRQVPGVCATCGAVGHTCRRVSSARVASCDEVWIANQTGTLIAAVSAGQRFSIDALRSAVYEMAKAIGGGYPYRAAQECGFNKARLFDWINGARLIKLRPLLVLCATAGVNVVDAIQGRMRPCVGSNYRYLARASSGKRAPYEARRQHLLLVTVQDDRPSLSHVARELNVSTRTLRKALPEETALVIARYLDRVQANRILRMRETRRVLEEVAERLRSDGRPLTARNVWLEGGILVTPNSRFSFAFQQVLEAGAAERETNCKTDADDVRRD